MSIVQPDYSFGGISKVITGEVVSRVSAQFNNRKSTTRVREFARQVLVPFQSVKEKHDIPDHAPIVAPRQIREQHVVLTTYPPIYKSSEGGGGTVGALTPRIFPPIYFVDGSEHQTPPPGPPIPDQMIYGVEWDKSANPNLTRIGDAQAMIAQVGVDDFVPRNDFDHAPIFGEMHDVQDDYGNWFVRIPKFYIRKRDEYNYKSWEVSKTKHEGFYLPYCFWDFDNEAEVDYFDVGKYLASTHESNLASRTGAVPTVLQNISSFRSMALGNNTGSVTGYHLIDLHTMDVLRTLMFVEFATLDPQTIMTDYSSTSSGDTDLSITGTTDAVAAPSGSPVDNLSGRNSAKYRGIENPYGIAYQMVDGANFSGRQAFVALDPRHYNTGTITGNYVPIDYLTHAEDIIGESVISATGFDENYPFAEFPVAGSPPRGGYYADQFYTNIGSGLGILFTGGSNNSTMIPTGGISHWRIRSTGVSFNNVTSRLVRRHSSQ